MIRKTLTDLQFAAVVTSHRAPPDPEMSVVVRGVWSIGEDGTLQQVTDALDMGFLSGETYAEDDPGRIGAPLRAGDFGHFKPGAEVLVRANCHTPGGKPLPKCPVSVQVGNWKKELVVFGDRPWKPLAVGKAPGEAGPFTTMPITWDRATFNAANNPVGRTGDSEFAPNVEYPGVLISSSGSLPPAAGFGPTNPEWPERNAMRGRKYGKQYSNTRAPFFSEDFDWSYFFCAPADQRMDGYFNGDEPVQLLNLHPQHEVLRFSLPGVKPRAFVNDVQGNFREVDLQLDTVSIDTIDNRVALLWRGLTPVQDIDFDDVTILYVDCEPEAKTLAEYKAATLKWEADPIGIDDALPKEFREAMEAGQKARDAGMTPAEIAAGGSGPDPVTRLLNQTAAQTAAGAGVSAQVQQSIQQATDGMQQVSGMNPDAPVNEAIADQLAAGPLLKAPPAMPATWGIKPRIPLGKEYDQVAMQKAEMLAMDAPPEAMEKLDELLANPKWATFDPALAPKVAAFRAGAGMEPAPELDLRSPDPTVAVVAGAAAIGSGAFALARIKAGLVEPPKLTISGVPERDPALHGPFGPDYGPKVRNLVDADLRNLDLTMESFEGANLYGADLSGCRLAGVSLRGANLEHCTLYKADLTGCDLTGANLYMAMCDQATFVNAKLNDAFLEAASFIKANMLGCQMQRAFGPYAQFAEARLSGALADGLQAPGANFDKASMNATSLIGAELVKATMHEATAEGIDLTDAIITGLSATKAKFHKAVFRCAVADRANLSDSDCEGADFTAASLANALLQNTRLPNAICEWADMRFANLRKACLDFVRFSRANLRNADLSRASCVETRFPSANMHSAALLEATISNCDFTGSNVQRALTRPTS